MDINRRKIEHIEALQKDKEIERAGAGWDNLRLQHRALPELDFDAIDTSITFFDKRLSFPFMIASMTGGDHDLVRTINKRLAEAAEQCQVALALGSQRVMLKNSAARESFALRKFAPTIPIFSNLGAVQLNYGLSEIECEEALAVAEADGLFLHLNPLQEVIQPEGNRNFAGLAEKINALKLSKPVLIKEVGCGLSLLDLQKLAATNIDYFDIAGQGGTSWSRIEAHRGGKAGFNFQDWGLSTVEALRVAVNHYPEKKFIASGGIRSGIDIAKALILGAELTSAAAPILAAALKSTSAVVELLQLWQQQFKICLFLLSCANCSDLRGKSAFLVENHHEYRH